MSWFKAAGIALALSLLAACQAIQPFQTKDTTPRLADLSVDEQAPSLDDLVDMAQPSVSAVVDLGEIDTMDALIQSYEELLPLVKEPKTKVTILHRLADLKLKREEDHIADAEVENLDLAIGAYEALLAKYPERPENDQIIYQLAKSYDLKANQDQFYLWMTKLVDQYPNSPYVTEVQFRRGELLFSWGDYQQALAAFDAVIKADEAFSSRYLNHSYYMYGWSLFKRARYAESLVAFSKVLDRISDTESLAKFETPSNKLALDVYRVMGLAFTSLSAEGLAIEEGAVRSLSLSESIDWLYEGVGAKPYESESYEQFANMLLSQEQYSDAIAVYQAFIERHPLDRRSPRFHKSVIDISGQAKFLVQRLEERELFVENYGVDSLYWRALLPQKDAFVVEILHELIPKLANLYYLKAQKEAKTEKTAFDAVQSYRIAGGYFSQFIETFPEDESVPETLVLLGQSYVNIEHWFDAIATFERAGYDYPEYPQAADAAYRSVVLYDDYIASYGTPEKTEGSAADNKSLELHAERISLQQQSRLRFVERWAKDDRAPEVLYVAANHAYANQNYEQSVQLSARLAAWPHQATDTQVAASPEVTLKALILNAHSEYALQNYVLAEEAYQVVYDALTPEDERYKSIAENLAVSIYQQAKFQVEIDQLSLAVEHLIRLGLRVPGASIRAEAELEAISHLVTLEDWNSVITQISLFRQVHPFHEKLPELGPKLALAYRETSQWELAAIELEALMNASDSEQEKQVLLQNIAQLYDQAENFSAARLAYRQYLNTYPTADATYLAFAARLSELYIENGETLKQRFWLAKQIKAVDELGDQATDGMIYQAASAQIVLADDAYGAFKVIALKQPLQESMALKTEAMEKAILAYQKTMDYQVQAFSTKAGFRMADLYGQFSEALLESDRPDGLDELEMEQYEILLEEQAFPMEDSAIYIHEDNAAQSWNGAFDDWVAKSFHALKGLLPGRYNKPELEGEIVDDFR